MEIRQVRTEDTKQFCELIVDMYSHIENLEWFTPMPYDYDSVKNMIEKPRFFIIGVFEGDELCGVSSLDYKCGKLIGKFDFPEKVNTDQLVEIGFNIVHSKHQGKGLMKQMVAYLLTKITNDGFKWVFAKVHKDNFASSKSLLKNGFEIAKNYEKPVGVEDFKNLASQDFFSKNGKQNAEKTLAKYNADATEIIVEYNILLKELN